MFKKIKEMFKKKKKNILYFNLSKFFTVKKVMIADFFFLYLTMYKLIILFLTRLSKNL